MSTETSAWRPKPETEARMPTASGNAINGLGEPTVRRPSLSFWHDADAQPLGDFQRYTIGIMYGSEDSGPIRDAFAIDPATGQFGQRGPAPIERAPTRTERSPEGWAATLKAFALANEADVVGIAALDPLWVYEGYEVPHSNLIVVGVAHDYEAIRHAPSPPGDNRGIVEVGRQYTRAARAANTLRNFILAQGYSAIAYDGPTPTALNFIPAAIAAGLGELGKHGSLINRKLGASFRLSVVATDMPLHFDAPDDFGADEFCTACRVCTRACPPGAIIDVKQLVRGAERWYVDFERCIPYFAETRGCAICIAVCPWSRPGVADGLAAKLARRRERRARTD